MKELTEKEKEEIRIMDNYISVQILLESVLYHFVEENHEKAKSINPIIANMCRKDIEALHRNHEYYIKKFRPILNTNLLDDFEELVEIIENYVKIKKID
jgi:hypothetical protein